MRRIEREADSILVNVKIASKFMECEMFRNIYTTNICPTHEFATTVCPHLKSLTELLERDQRNVARMVDDAHIGISKNKGSYNIRT